MQVSFDVDLKVNVFEANIRLLGGLLSAHLLASDANLGLMQKKYSGELLDLAVDLGDRLMVAFTASPTCKFCTVRTCMLETLLPDVGRDSLVVHYRQHGEQLHHSLHTLYFNRAAVHTVAASCWQGSMQCTVDTGDAYDVSDTLNAFSIII